MRKDIETDQRLFGGIIQSYENCTGVLYNADGATTEALATTDNITVAVITRNRCAYLRDLLNSIDACLPKDVPRLVLVNNTHDDTLEMLARDFKDWIAHSLQSTDFPKESKGLLWFRSNQPDILPKLLKMHAEGYGPTDSIAWLRNQMILRCRTRFLISFDDDMLVKPGWLSYFLTLQNRLYSFAVINNFAAFLLDTTVIQRIGWFDERFLRSHGYEDNDFLSRINEARLRWVLGYNQNHDWRSAEEGNPRGSGTGSDLFIHRYAKRDGGFSASRIENDAAAKDSSHFGNWCWQRAKWKQVATDTGIQDRPPFKGYFLERLVKDEPGWHNRDSPEIAAIVPLGNTVSTASGRKTTQNTRVSEIDIFTRPASSTMIDRYVFLSHWCKGRRVLDAGCGYGYGSALLYNLGAAEVTGLDVDPDAVEWARERYGRAGLTFATADLLDLTPLYCERPYDTVICIEVFEHLDRTKIEALIGSLRRATADGGTVILTTPRRKSHEWDNQGGTHLYEYSCDEFQALLNLLFKDATLHLSAIQEFQVQGSTQWFSAWKEKLDDTATVMVAIAEKVPPTACIPQALNAPTKGALAKFPEQLPRLSLLISNRNTLPFLKLAVKSCREYLARPDHEIIIYDDASTDGSIEWLTESEKHYNFKVLLNPGPERKGIVYVYDELVRAASLEVVWLMHSDMFFARAADLNVWRHFGPKTAATCTRIEPPLYPEESFRLLQDFGRDAETFKEEAFLRFAETKKEIGRITTGIFAPLMISRQDYLNLGGHDKLFAPQSREDSDLFNRMQLAGLHFVQSWSSFCYHFSGRGSRRKDVPDRDSEEWRLTNTRNERNFVRKWGCGVRHDRWLMPSVPLKRPITLVGLLGNEAINVKEWMFHLEPFFDEVILIDDSEDNGLELAQNYFEQDSQVCSHLTLRKLRIIKRPLAGDFAAARNAGQAAATFDWVFHVDLDERLSPDLLENLQDLIRDLENQNKTVCGFRRVNTLDGTIVNDIPRTEWTSDMLKALSASASNEFRNPDTQFRLLRRQMQWVRPIHERPEPVDNMWRGGTTEAVAVAKCGLIYHRKTLVRQAEQDLYYRQMEGNNGPDSA